MTTTSRTRTPKAKTRRRPRPPLPPDVTAELRELNNGVRDMLTPAELADMLDVGERTIQRRCHAKEWPHHRLPGRGPAGKVRFTADDVREILALLKLARVAAPVTPARRSTSQRPDATTPRRRKAS